MVITVTTVLSRFTFIEKICVLKNFEKFTRKRLCWSLFFHKVAGWRTSTFWNKYSLLISGRVLLYAILKPHFSLYLQKKYSNVLFCWIYNITGHTLFNFVGCFENVALCNHISMSSCLLIRSSKSRYLAFLLWN